MKKEMIDNAKRYGRKYLDTHAIGVITVIMGDLSTSAKEKVVEVNRTLRDLDIVKRDESLPWDTDAKKTPTAMEVPQEIYHLDCTIDLSRVESLLGFPLIERGPACNRCQCFKCNQLPDCHYLEPTTLHYCRIQCKGRTRVRDCEKADKENGQCL